MRPGISTSASSISLRPNSASERSATLKSDEIGRGAVDGGRHRRLRRSVGERLSASASRHRRRELDCQRSRPGSPDDSPGGPTSAKAQRYARASADAAAARRACVQGSRHDHRPAHRERTTSGPPSCSRCMRGFGMTVADGGRRVPHPPARRPIARSRCSTASTIVATGGGHPRSGSWCPAARRCRSPASPTVTVHPTHRRRGLLRRMMHEQLDDVARRGEPLAALTASEASIYERFGYGTATFTIALGARSRSTRASARRRRPAAGSAFVDGADGGQPPRTRCSHAPPAGRVGELVRPEAWWPPIFTSGDRGPRFFTVVHDEPDGAPDAFAALRPRRATGPTRCPATICGSSRCRPSTPRPKR